MNNEPLRPDPDRLLEQTAAPHRGKLKVFFGEIFPTKSLMRINMILH